MKIPKLPELKEYESFEARITQELGYIKDYITHIETRPLRMTYSESKVVIKAVLELKRIQEQYEKMLKDKG